MKTKTKTDTSSGSVDESRQLIESAMKKPGVAELFKVYDSWQRYEQVYELHNQFTATKQIVTISSSSDPVVHQLA